MIVGTEQIKRQNEDTLNAENTRIAAELKRAHDEITERNEKIAFLQELGAKRAEDAAKIISEREALRGELAEKASTKATTDREALRKELAVRTEEIAILTKSLAVKIKEIETQQSIATRNATEATKLAAERQAIEKQLAARSAEADKSKADLTAFQKSGDEKLAAIT